MTKRLQELFDDAEYAALQAAATARGLTVAEWVRQAVAAARRSEASGDVDRKLTAIRSAARHAGPTGQVERLAAEIDRGYATGPGADPTPGSY